VLRFVSKKIGHPIRCWEGQTSQWIGHGRGRLSDNRIEINPLGLTIPLQSRGGPYIYGHMDFLCRDEDDHQDVRVACNTGGPPNSYR
jgi:hypothetical protein